MQFWSSVKEIANERVASNIEYIFYVELVKTAIGSQLLRSYKYSYMHEF